MNELTEDKLKELEEEAIQEGDREQWLIYAGQLWEVHARALISAAREWKRIVSKLRDMCESALDPTGMRLGENNGSIWAQSVLDVLETPKELRPPVQQESASKD